MAENIGLIPLTGIAEGDYTGLSATSNGWVWMAKIADTDGNYLKVLRSADNGATWSEYYAFNIGGARTSTNSLSITSYGNRLVIIYQFGSSAPISFRYIGVDVGSLAGGTYNSQQTTSLYFSTPFSMNSEYYGMFIRRAYLGSDNILYISYHVYQTEGGEYSFLSKLQYGVNASFTATSYTDNGFASNFIELGGKVWCSADTGIISTPLNAPTTAFSSAYRPGGIQIIFGSLFVHPSNGYIYCVSRSQTYQYIALIARTTDMYNFEYFDQFDSAWKSINNFGAIFINTTANFVGSAHMDTAGNLYLLATDPTNKRIAQIKMSISSTGVTAKVGETYPLTAQAGDTYISGSSYFDTLTNFSGGNTSRSITSFMAIFTTGFRTFVRINNTAPNAPTVTSPTAYANTRTPTISWTFNDPDSGDTQAGYEVSIVNSTYTAQLWSTGYVAGTATSYTIPAGAITADGSYYFRVRVWDASGTVNIANGTSPDSNYGGRSTATIIDTVAPTIASVSPAQYINASSNNFDLWAYGVSESGSGISSVYGEVRDTSNNLLTTFGYIQSGSTNNYYVTLTTATAFPGGFYKINVFARDNAGNISSPSVIDVTKDTASPISTTQTNGTLYATSNGVSWSAFNDPAPSSGLLLTTLYLQQWNGSSWVNVSGYPKSVVGLTNNMTGLTPATQYRWGVTYTDNAGNVSTLNYTTFTTNSYSVSTSVNLSASGYTLNKRPKFKFTVTDANDATLTNFQIQVSAVNDFSTTLLDTTSSAVAAGWSATSLSSGATGYYTPQADITTGTRYVRIRAYDGKDWGSWSATAAFTIQAGSWPTIIASDDTAISKRTIDDLRTKVNAIRQARGLAAAAWTDTSIQDWTNGASATNVRAVHLIELRQAITDIYTALSTGAPSWAPDTVIDTTKDRKGQHWQDLRTALLGT